MGAKSRKGGDRASQKPENVMCSYVDQAIIANFAQILARATEVIGDQADALRWLGTPVRDLNYKTPISLLGDSAGTGAEAVFAALTKIEHGVL